MRKVRVFTAVVCVGLWGAASTAPAAQAACKTGLTNRYQNAFFAAEVVTNWCYRRGNVTSRKSIPRAWIRTAGMAGGWQEGATDLAYSGCNNFNGYPKHNCLTRFQFSFWNIATPWAKVGVCLHTRIYGNGRHRRKITTNC